MEMPNFKISEPLLIGLALTGCVVAYVLWLENKKLRSTLDPQAKKPCNCEEKQPDLAQLLNSLIASGNITQSAPRTAPPQSYDDPTNPPTTVVDL